MLIDFSKLDAESRAAIALALDGADVFDDLAAALITAEADAADIDLGSATDWQLRCALGIAHGAACAVDIAAAPAAFRFFCGLFIALSSEHASRIARNN